MTTAIPRVTARIDVNTQELLAKAAAISGISSINSFVLNAAVEKAMQIIEREQALQLTARDAALLVEALDRPADPNPRLKAAFARYEQQGQ